MMLNNDLYGHIHIISSSVGKRKLSPFPLQIALALSHFVSEPPQTTSVIPLQAVKLQAVAVQVPLHSDNPSAQPQAVGAAPKAPFCATVTVAALAWVAEQPAAVFTYSV
jgi:hypothetical protein